MATDTTAGFKFEFCMHGNPPWIMKLLCKDTETLTKGDMANLESGEIDLAATGDAGLLGIILETKAGVDSTTVFEVIVDPQAVYSVYDANARAAGATLDIAGATGAQTVTASSNKEFVVIAPSAATERTLVMINRDAHPFAKVS